MERVAIIGGCRTPFAKAFTTLKKYSFIDLGAHVIRECVSRLSLDPAKIDECIFGTVLVDPRVPNFAREIVFKAGLPKTVGGHAVSNNCISGLLAASVASEAIQTGRISCALAGGSESMSNPTLALRPKGEDFFKRLARARSTAERLKTILSFRLKYALPIPPSPKEPSTGLTMGEHCEMTAKEFSITRESQDRRAYLSHVNAAKAAREGILGVDVAPIGGESVDNIIRSDTTIEKLAALRPVFDRSEKGTLTAGNSSALTDGASVVCFMSETRARAEGRKILGYLSHIEFAAIEPNDGLLMAPALALPKLLERKGLSVSDIDLFEIHEAFGAQVEANLSAWEKGWKRYPNLKPIGKIPEEKINVNGGSIAIGHPFAATGGRLILAALRELEKRGKNRAAISVCAAGAMAGAALVEIS